MGIEVYEKMAKYYDTFPVGFPQTEEKIEIEILKRFFSEEEAEFAIHLPMTWGAEPPRKAQAVAEQMDRDAGEVERILDAMAKNGLIVRAGDKSGAGAYALLPFAPGLLELNVHKVDAELALLLDKYYGGAFGQVMANGKVPLVKTIPVNHALPEEMIVHHYDSVISAIEEAGDIRVMPCICRTRKKLIGEDCGKPLETCILLHTDQKNEGGLGRKVSKEEAIAIVREAEEAGCIHLGSNSKEIMGICSCCGCCCLPLSLLIKTKNVGIVAKSAFFATADPDVCSGCEACVDRCWIEALKIENEQVVIDRQRCIGCGRCIKACPVEAISMQRRPEGEMKPTPQDKVQLFSEMGWRK